MTLTDRFSRLCHLIGEKQYVAKMMGVDPATISRKCSGKIPISQRDIILIEGAANKHKEKIDAAVCELVSVRGE